MERFEKENGGELVVATLCLLEVSQRGLLETELLQILADEDNLAPRENAKDEGAEKGKRCRQKTAVGWFQFLSDHCKLNYHTLRGSLVARRVPVIIFSPLIFSSYMLRVICPSTKGR